jgi:hypothetical protein
LTAQIRTGLSEKICAGSRRVGADPNPDRIPLEIVQRLSDDENPVTLCASIAC